MKTRRCFVSNSSTSSFIIGSKEPVTLEMLEKLLGIEENKLSTTFLKEIAATIWERMNEEPWKSVEAYKAEKGHEPGKEIKNLIDGGYLVYEGRFGDDEHDTAECFLCYQEIDFTSDEFVMKKDAAY